MMLLPTALLVASILATFKSAASQLDSGGGVTRDLENSLPACRGKTEQAFYTLDITLRQLPEQCSDFQMSAIGFFLQDIVEDVEKEMPEYKREYMKAIVCPIPDEEPEHRLLEAGRRNLQQRRRYIWRSRGTCRRCRARNNDRRYLSAYSAADICIETEKALFHMKHAKHAAMTAHEMFASIVKMTDAYENDLGQHVVAIAEEDIANCEKAIGQAAIGVTESSLLCDKGRDARSSASIRNLMRKAEQATENTKKASLQVEDALAQITKAKNRIEEATQTSSLGSAETIGAIRDLAELTSEDVCQEASLALSIQNEAESDVKTAARILQGMRDMSKSHENHKDVEDILKDAEKYCEDVKKEKDNVIEEVEKAAEKCHEARSESEKGKGPDHEKLLKEAKKETEDAEKKLLKVKEKLLKLRGAEIGMDELAEILDFDPIMTELEDTIVQANDDTEGEIEGIEAEIAEIDEELAATTSTLNEQMQEVEAEIAEADKELAAGTSSTPPTANPSTTAPSTTATAAPVWTVVTPAPRIPRIFRPQQVYHQNWDGGPLQIIHSRCEDSSMSAVNWNRHAQTSNMTDWLSKFGTLLAEAISSQLTNFNSTAGGCVDDNSFCVIVNITEVEYAFEDGPVSEDCVNRMDSEIFERY